MYYYLKKLSLQVFAYLLVLIPLKPRSQFNTIGIAPKTSHQKNNQSALGSNHPLIYTTDTNMQLSIENKLIQIHAPLKSLYITSYRGWRIHPIMGKLVLHQGIDLRANFEPVYAVMDGVVKKSGFDKASGHYISIIHSPSINSSYAHLSRAIVKEGQKVKAGDIIGISGNSGASNAPHLHFRVF